MKIVTSIMCGLIAGMFSCGVLLADDLKWSNSTTEKTPQGDVTFHGRFGNETVAVSTNHFEQHAFLDIQFDLLILRSWDGSVEIGTENRPATIGPDFFKVAMRDGATLLYTTFSNRPDDKNFDVRGKFQNFPSPMPGDHFDPQTGSTAHNSRGYCYAWPGPPQAVPMDATYHIHLIVPHDAPQAVLEMTGIGLQAPIDEFWGVTNLEIQPLTADKEKTPDANAIAIAFKGAMDIQTPDQMEAFQTLILGGDEAVQWIAANVTPQPVDTNQAQQWIKDLGADDSGIDTRESAAGHLRELGPALEPLLRDAQKTAAIEQRVRIEWQLEMIGVTQIDDENIRRVVLATRVLEIIGTPKAMELRKNLTSK